MDFLISNAFTFFIVAAIAFFVIRQIKRKKGEGASNTGGVNGDTDYQGTTGGIEWTLRSSVWLSGGRHRSWKRKSAWRTAAVHLPVGKFILLMSTPVELKKGPIERGGFMNNLINKASDLAIDLYITGYFGSEYCALVNIGDDGVKLEREALKDFLVLTNHEAVAQTYFDEATTNAIANWKKNNQGFSQEDKVDQFGLLFSPDGVILACQASMNNAEEVKLFSDFGAALVTKMREMLAQA
mgnify:FL=1